MKTKRVITMMAAVGMVLSLAACGGKTSFKNESKNNPSSEVLTDDIENVQIPSPWTEFKSLEEAEQNAGFSFEIPEIPEGYQLAWIQNMNQELIEVVYKTTEDENASANECRIYFRKGIGTEDISGDYNEYTESRQITIGSYEVTMKGNEGMVSLATWTDGAYSYAVAVPVMSEEDVTALILQIK